MDRDNTLWDGAAREPVRQATRKGAAPDTGDEVTIKGQVSYYFAGARLDYPTYRREGVVEESSAYVTLRFKDMVKAGLVVLDVNGDFDSLILKRGDRIVKLGKRTVDFYVTGFKDFAHYPSLSQTLIQVNFEDRHPTHQKGDL